MQKKKLLKYRVSKKLATATKNFALINTFPKEQKKELDQVARMSPVLKGTPSIPIRRGCFQSGYRTVASRLNCANINVSYVTHIVNSVNSCQLH